LSSTLLQPNWATNEYGQTPKPLILLKNITGLTFVYFSADQIVIPAGTTPELPIEANYLVQNPIETPFPAGSYAYPYAVPSNKYCYVNMGSSDMLEYVVAPNVISIKSIVLNFTTTEPFAGSPAQSNLTMSSGPVIMKNKSFLQ